MSRPRTWFFFRSSSMSRNAASWIARRSLRLTWMAPRTALVIIPRSPFRRRRSLRGASPAPQNAELSRVAAHAGYRGLLRDLTDPFGRNVVFPQVLRQTECPQDLLHLVGKPLDWMCGGASASVSANGELCNQLPCHLRVGLQHERKRNRAGKTVGHLEHPAQRGGKAVSGAQPGVGQRKPADERPIACSAAHVDVRRVRAQTLKGGDHGPERAFDQQRTKGFDFGVTYASTSCVKASSPGYRSPGGESQGQPRINDHRPREQVRRAHASLDA